MRAKLTLLLYKLFRRTLLDAHTGKAAFQPLWEEMHGASLRGMNVMRGNVVEVSGELWLMDWLRGRFEGRQAVTVIDVGGNDGQWAGHLARRLDGLNYAIHSFEPSATAYRALEAVALKHANVHAYPIGMGAKSERRTLYADRPGSDMASLFELSNPVVPFRAEASQSVSVSTLDEFVAEKGIETVDYLKIDTEGFEYAVLTGASRLLAEKRVELVQFEFGSGMIEAGRHFYDFYRLLSDDFRLYRVLQDGLRELERYDLKQEVYVTANYLAIRKSA